jgi:hypothetical protein
MAFGWGPGHIWLHTTLEDPWPHYMSLEVCWDNLWTLSFRLSQFHGHGSWLVCEVALNCLHIFLLIGQARGPTSKKMAHLKLRNINPHNVTHSLISWNPRERMFVVQISLLIVTFLSLISQNVSKMQTTKEANPHPHIAPCVNMWSITFLFLFFFCNFLNVGACIRHIAWEGQVECTTLA